MSSYSKAPRGLFVLLRVNGIFTTISTSPGPLLRQCSARYAFRAGRNLPDKEFRYLRTVIVTAAVHRGFGSSREALPLTFRHWAGVSPYTSAFAFAETCVFVKQSAEPFRCDHQTLRQACHPHPQWQSFSLSYGLNLPNSLTRVLPFALVFSTHLPVSVCGTVTHTSLEAFLGSSGSATCGPCGHRHHPSGSRNGFPYPFLHPTGLAPESSNWLAYPPASPLHSIGITWYRNINLLSIDYAIRPRLRTD